MTDGPVQNTDRTLWRNDTDEVRLTADGVVYIGHGGHFVGETPAKWLEHAGRSLTLAGPELLRGMTAQDVRELVDANRLEAWSEHGEHVEVMHGSRCVGLMLHDEDGAAAGGLVLSPDVARHLAVVLIEQAASSERPEAE